MYLPLDGRDINWTNLEHVGSIVRKFVGISDQPWLEALATVGPAICSALVAVVVAKAGGTAKRPPIRSKGGYFRGMVRKAAAGALNLDPTIYALRDALEAAESFAVGQLSNCNFSYIKCA